MHAQGSRHAIVRRPQERAHALRSPCACTGSEAAARVPMHCESCVCAQALRQHRNEMAMAQAAMAQQMQAKKQQAQLAASIGAQKGGSKGAAEAQAQAQAQQQAQAAGGR